MMGIICDYLTGFVGSMGWQSQFKQMQAPKDEKPETKEQAQHQYKMKGMDKVIFMRYMCKKGTKSHRHQGGITGQAFAFLLQKM
jgi:Tfp pilus assembly protein PilO